MTSTQIGTGSPDFKGIGPTKSNCGLHGTPMVRSNGNLRCLKCDKEYVAAARQGICWRHSIKHPCPECSRNRKKKLADFAPIRLIDRHKPIRLEPWEIPPDYVDLPRSIEAARAMGSKLYFRFNDETGEYQPCRKGHIAARRVAGKSNYCTQCNHESRLVSRKADSYERIAKKVKRDVAKAKLKFGDSGQVLLMAAVKGEAERYLAKGDKMQAAMALDKSTRGEIGKVPSNKIRNRRKRQRRAAKNIDRH